MFLASSCLTFNFVAQILGWFGRETTTCIVGQGNCRHLQIAPTPLLVRSLVPEFPWYKIYCAAWWPQPAALHNPLGSVVRVGFEESACGHWQWVDYQLSVPWFNMFPLPRATRHGSFHGTTALSTVQARFTQFYSHNNFTAYIPKKMKIQWSQESHG